MLSRLRRANNPDFDRAGFVAARPLCTRGCDTGAFRVCGSTRETLLGHDLFSDRNAEESSWMAVVVDVSGILGLIVPDVEVVSVGHGECARGYRSVPW